MCSPQVSVTSRITSPRYITDLVEHVIVTQFYRKCFTDLSTFFLLVKVDLGTQFLLMGGPGGGSWVPAVHLLLVLSQWIKDDLPVVQSR
jgi:hypothetical protein